MAKFSVHFLDIIRDSEKGLLSHYFRLSVCPSVLRTKHLQNIYWKEHYFCKPLFLLPTPRSLNTCKRLSIR